jgi:predicted N-acetyltransferase YhbS
MSITTGTKLRLAGPSDIEEITGLINRAFSRTEGFFIDGDRIDAAEVSDSMDRGWFILAEDTGGVAGCVYVELRGQRAYFGLLSVEQARQKEGLGRQLVAAAEDRARDAGCQFMDLLVVNLRSELPPYYRKMGYEQTGTKPFPEDVATRVPCHFVAMSKRLM